jgi:hypothetical protein
MSTRSERTPKALLRGAALFVLVAGFTQWAFAQYYEEETQSYVPSMARFISAGFFSRDFSPRAENSAPDSLKISYDRVMPLLGYRHGAVEILFGYTKYHLAAASCSAVYLGATFNADFPLTGGRRAAVVLPLIIAADFTKSESSGSDRDHFNVGSLGVGTGLKFRLIQPGFEFSVQAGGIILYSFQGFSVESGSSASLTGDAVILLGDVPIFDGISVGYRFRLQSWSMSGGRFDYRTVNHGAFLGVMF